eukprot:169287-Prorocentrum_minimum.AAC.1
MKPPRATSKRGQPSVSAFKQTCIAAFFAQPAQPSSQVSGSKRVLEDESNRSQPEAKQTCKSAPPAEEDSLVSARETVAERVPLSASAARTEMPSDKTAVRGSESSPTTRAKCVVENEPCRSPSSEPHSISCILPRPPSGELPNTSSGTCNPTLNAEAYPVVQGNQASPSHVNNESLTPDPGVVVIVYLL